MNLGKLYRTIVMGAKGCVIGGMICLCIETLKNYSKGCELVAVKKEKEEEN